MVDSERGGEEGIRGTGRGKGRDGHKMDIKGGRGGSTGEVEEKSDGMGGVRGASRGTGKGGGVRAKNRGKGRRKGGTGGV